MNGTIRLEAYPAEVSVTCYECMKPKAIFVDNTPVCAPCWKTLTAERREHYQHGHWVVGWWEDKDEDQNNR